mmetsp:Transcript_12746/g.30347  ORF Transcript_12746/g.30347 Transcript_12746/m.30347 type:complete len:94 (-) Transcript_12746:197-478(-)
MTYRARGRSMVEVVLAICFVVFLVGFITVLCIGNYFRAKRAQERQRQRRLSKLAGASGNNSVAPGSVATGMYTNDGGMSYEAPPHVMAGGVQA